MSLIPLISAMVYWNNDDPLNEGWWYRVRYADADEFSGTWNSVVNERDGGIADAVIDLVAQYGGGTLESGDIAIEGLCGEWRAE
jgi:hypothetical protein